MIHPTLPNRSKHVKARRFRISLRALLVCVTVAGIIFGLIGRSVQYQKLMTKRRAVLREQYEVTGVILERLRMTNWPPPYEDSIVPTRMGGHSAQYGPTAWRHGVRWWLPLPKAQRQAGTSLKMEGGLDELDVLPITIRDRGAVYNRAVIVELAKAYAEKKWTYRIVIEDAATDTGGDNDG